MLQKAKRFFRSLSPRLEPSDETLAREVLGGELYALFGRMCEADKAHAVRVLKAMDGAGGLEDWQRQAALLHDIGKAEAPPTVFQRVIFSLLERFSPGRLQRVMRGDAPIAGAMLIMYNHPMLGRALAAGKTSDERLLAAIEGHHAESTDPFIALLKEYDAAN